MEVIEIVNGNITNNMEVIENGAVIHSDNIDSNSNSQIKNDLKNLIDRIELSDTISQFMEKCNNNFAKIAEVGGGPAGVKGDVGSQGVPTKPKVPIHVWKKGKEYIKEEPQKNEENEDVFILNYEENLEGEKYQVGHLILLENAHVYRLEVNDEDQSLIPKFMYAMDSYDINKINDEKKAHVHFMYANSKEELKEQGVSDDKINTNENRYIGICSNNSNQAPTQASDYIWNRMGDDGENAYVFFDFKNDEDLKDIVKDNKYETQYIGVCSINSNKKPEKIDELKPDDLSDYYWIKVGKNGKDGDNGRDGRDGRVLFYLGSFKNRTLTGESTIGKLTDVRCDYYIDFNGVGWIRKGTQNESIGFYNGNDNNKDDWEEIGNTDIGFLTNGVINIDTIDTDTLSNSDFAKKIFCKDVISNVGYIPDLVNTNQYSHGDKVVVSGNNIKIINSDGYTTTLITSDDINIKKDESYYKNYLFNIVYNVFKEANELTNIGSQYYEIGYINDYSTIEFTLIASLSNYTENINFNDWSFEGNLYLIIERYNVDSNKWEEKQILQISSTESWEPCDYIGNIIKEDDENYYNTPYKTQKKDIKLNEQEGGTYRFKIFIDIINSNIPFNNVLLKTNCNVSNGIEDEIIYDKIKIGKNGIVANLNVDDNNQKTEFNVLKNEILMRVGNFALKICKDGIYKTQDYESCYNNYPTEDGTWESLF